MLVPLIIFVSLLVGESIAISGSIFEKISILSFFELPFPSLSSVAIAYTVCLPRTADQSNEYGAN